MYKKIVKNLLENQQKQYLGVTENGKKISKKSLKKSKKR